MGLDPRSRSIAMIAEQNILIGTDYRLRIRVSGNPDKVGAYGDFEFFSHYWDPDNQEINIVGTPKELTKGKIWRAEAVWNDDPTNIVKREITYNVLPSAPIIINPGKLIFYKGVDYEMNPVIIEIRNDPGESNISGLLVGLGQTDGEGGKDIIGSIGDDVALTSDGSLDVFASNDGGEDLITDIPFSVFDLPDVYIFEDALFGNDNLFVYGNLSLDSDTNFLLEKTIRPAGTISPRHTAMNFDTKELYVLSSNIIEVFDVDKDDAAVVQRSKRIHIPAKYNSATNRGISIDAENNMLYLCTGHLTGLIGVFSLNIANGATLSAVREFTVPSIGTQFLTGGLSLDIVANRIYLNTFSTTVARRIIVLDSETPDGGAASVIEAILFENPNAYDTNLIDYEKLSGTNILLTIMQGPPSGTTIFRRLDMWNLNDISAPIKTLNLPNAQSNIDLVGIGFA